MRQRDDVRELSRLVQHQLRLRFGHVGDEPRLGVSVRLEEMEPTAVNEDPVLVRADSSAGIAAVAWDGDHSGLSLFLSLESGDVYALLQHVQRRRIDHLAHLRDGIDWYESNSTGVLEIALGSASDDLSGAYRGVVLRPACQVIWKDLSIS